MIVFDAGQKVIEWLASRVGEEWRETPMRACAEMFGDRITGAWAYYWFQGHDIHVTLALERSFLSRAAYYWIHAIPFLQYQVRRMTAVIAEDNRRSRRLVEHAGYRQEGLLRKGMSNGRDAIIYGLLREECRFI